MRKTLLDVKEVFVHKLSGTAEHKVFVLVKMEAFF